MISGKNTGGLIITFHTTAGAMALEKSCKKNALPGRLIPVPREISSGCGLAWHTKDLSREALETFIQQQRLEVDQIHNR